MSIRTVSSESSLLEDTFTKHQTETRPQAPLFSCAYTYKTDFIHMRHVPKSHELLFFQRELSIIDFTLNYPPIRNNLTSVSLLSMLIETDYLNYPPIRNNLTSASLLSINIEMNYNLLGMKARTVPRCRDEIYFSFPKALRGVIPYFFRSVICK